MRIMLGFALLLVIAGGLFAQPVASRITTGVPDVNYQTAVTGAASAVEPNADVALVTIETGHYATARAAADGTFSASIFAPRGAAILVKSDPQHAFVPQIAAGPALVQGHLSQLLSLQGTIARVDVPAPQNGVAFAGAGVDPALNQASWIVEGTVAKRQFSPGDTIEVTGTYTLLASTLGSAVNPRFGPGLTLELLSDSGGRPATAWSLFDSATMTPTGLPIERTPSFGPSVAVSRPLTVNGTKASGTFTATYNIPVDFRPGHYLLRLGVGVQGVPMPPLDETVRRTTFVTQFRGRENMASVAVIRIGAPAAPRFAPILLMNDSSEGHRGAIAVEDRGRYAPANHIATATETTIVPRVDPRTGAARRYSLEPFTLSLGVGDRGGKLAGPLIPLRFPSGSLTVSVRAPSGTTRTLGPAPFRQWHLVGPATRDGQTMEGGPHITDAFQLRTLDPSFEISFNEDGRHTVTVDGTVDDLWGTAWRAGGTYEIDVARPLVIDSAVIPMTPFEVSNQILPAVHLAPPVPADVDVRVRHGSRSARFTGKANRFGHFASPDWFAFASAGEYRIDVTASYRDAAGTLWMGTRTWGGVVAPRDTPIIAHGRRGIDEQPDGEKQQWYFRSQTGDPMGRDHLQFAFHSGDVMWLQEGDSAIPIITFQDPTGSVTAAVTKLYNAARPTVGPFSDRVTKGEIPLFSASSNGFDVSLAPDRAEAWGYSYAAVERPLVRVREVIAEDGPMAYWRFNDRYGGQTGSGVNGDLPNDFKFQFGGVVLRGPLFDPPRYAIYGSLFVLVPTDDPGGGSRVFPPFQGNGSGPSGGPLFKLKGKDIELFFHPTGVRPGTVLVQGDTASFAGYSAPMLPSKIAVDITAPSGRVRTVKGQANRIGWFYDPGSDFAVDEPGVWKAKVKITFDGVLPSTSGQLSAPFPTGGVLGSRDGEFYFYVVRGDSTALAVNPATQFLRPADGPITFTITPPPALHDVQLTYTTTMPGFILEEGTTAALAYTYDAQRLAGDFPNLDLTDHEHSAGADVITISLLVSGTDAAGKRQFAARMIVIAGEELQAPAQPPTASPARRRAAR
ncbi:MAG: hypothetical protein AABO58_16375 [Acidobacteriota bacterium]